jgi:hypothetical protein
MPQKEEIIQKKGEFLIKFFILKIKANEQGIHRK